MKVVLENPPQKTLFDSRPSSLMRARAARTVVVCALLGGSFGLPCQAATQTSNDLSTSPYLFGDWGGTRTNLLNKGISFNFAYTNEMAHNFSGGDRRSTRDTHQLAAGMTMDLSRLWGISHTTFNVIMTSRFGRSLDVDAKLGTSQQTQEVYGRGQTVWLTKMTVDHTLLDGRVLVSFGRDNEGSAFDVSDCHFQNLALCGSQGPNLYGTYWMSWPGSVWMGRAKVNTTADTYLQFGVYQHSPTYYDPTWERHNAWAPTSPGGTNGVVLPIELGWTPKLGGYEGTYQLGFMYNTGGQPDLIRDISGRLRAITGMPARRSNQSYNTFLSVSQRLSGRNGGEGLNMTLRAVMGDRDTSALDRQMTLSLEYHNPFKRVGDNIGVGVAATHSSSRAAEYQAMYNRMHPDDATAVGTGYEYTYEVFYSWQALPSIALQPDLQYIVHPGGTSKNHNIVVAGLKSVIAF